eukprot:9963388-Heterocapsa_arctica.AAC.1
MRSRHPRHLQTTQALDVGLQDLSDYSDDELRTKWVDPSVLERLDIVVPGIHRRILLEAREA